MSTAVVVIQLTGSAIAVIVTVFAVATLLWISALVSLLIHGDDFERGSQLLWALTILLAGPVGAVLYFLFAGQEQVGDPKPIPDRRHRTEAISDPWSASKRST